MGRPLPQEFLNLSFCFMVCLDGTLENMTSIFSVVSLVQRISDLNHIKLLKCPKVRILVEIQVIIFYYSTFLTSTPRLLVSLDFCWVLEGSTWRGGPGGNQEAAKSPLVLWHPQTEGPQGKLLLVCLLAFNEMSSSGCFKERLV